MGLLTQPVVEPGRLVITPHPLILDGRRNLPCDLQPGETLRQFLGRHVPGLEEGTWEVAIGGIVVRRELWCHVRPKHGQVIEVRGALGKSVLAIVALVALFYFTLGTGGIAGGSFLGLSGAAGYVAAGAVYIAGSALINRVLAPKQKSLSDASPLTQDPTYSLTSQRNTFRPFEPVPLLFGKVKVAPDLASDQAYTFNRGNDQYLALTLNFGINVDRVDDLYQGDALLSSFEGVEVYHTGFSGMTEDGLPLYSNTDTVAGGSLDSPAGTYIQRTSADDSVRLEIDLEYTLFDYDTGGRPKFNTEGITVQYRAVGSGTWLAFGSATLSGNAQKVQRKTLTLNVAAGQYEVQVKRNNTASSGTNAHCEVSWSSLRSIQNDTGNYKGMARAGVVCKASGQLSGALDEIRAVAYSKDLPGWTGSAWVTSADYISNPGAQILKYARGFYDQDGQLIAGMGLSDSMIDLEALKGFILHCEANSYAYDYYLKDARNHDEVLNSIALSGFGQITWSGGRLSVCWADSDQPLSGVVNMATIKRGQFQVDYTLAGSADGIEYTYLDASDWTNKTLRVKAPGVTTMLNPARVAGEGVTDEAHAAKQARYHIAQSVYQFKAISYGTDLEHLSYRRMDLLSLQHDLTQWGYGGRVQAAEVVGGFVQLTLEEEVPAPGSETPYIGLRIPGETVMRVFEVDTFAEATRVVTLAEAWPSGVAIPGDSADNPAHDTLWVFDFKSEPGYRVRVVGIEPEDGLKGARVSVVPESDEFWTYVETGEYEPAPGSSLPSTRPVASSVQVAETVVAQGNTRFTELSITFELMGRMASALVFAQYTDTGGHTDGQLVKVAETTSLEASFRIKAAGTYDILIVPYSVDGVAGEAGAASYDTEATGTPPTNYDTLTVTETSEGMRRYSWAYDTDTLPSTDVVGVEIRYTPDDPTPVWDDMTPLVGSGFHASHFEAVVPGEGDWTFALRARDSSGTLSTSILTLDQSLGPSLGDVMDDKAVLAVGPNLAMNYTFFSGIGRWLNELNTTDGITQNVSNGYLRLKQTATNNPGGGNCTFHENHTFECAGGDVFFCSARGWGLSTTHAGRVAIRWADASGGLVSLQTVAEWAAGSGPSTQSAALTTPSGAVSGQVTAYIASAATDDEFLVTNIFIQRDLLMQPGSGAQLGDPRNQPMITVGNVGSMWDGLSFSWTTTTTSATITASAATLQVADQPISYNSANVTVSGSAGATITFYLYYDDPTYSGGSKTLNATTTRLNTANSKGRVYVGELLITFPTSGTGGDSWTPPPCVSVDAWVIRNGKKSRAGDVQVGDVLRLWDPVLGESEGVVTYAEPKLTDMVRIVSESGRTLTCSTSAPIPTERCGLVLAPDLMGHRVWVRGRWESVAAVERLPRGWVQHITVGDRCFLAGDQDADFAHHNIKNNVPNP